MLDEQILVQHRLRELWIVFSGFRVKVKEGRQSEWLDMRDVWRTMIGPTDLLDGVARGCVDSLNVNGSLIRDIGRARHLPRAEGTRQSILYQTTRNRMKWTCPTSSDF